MSLGRVSRLVTIGMSQELVTSGDTIGMMMTEDPVKRKPLTLPDEPSSEPRRWTFGLWSICCSIFCWDLFAQNYKVYVCSHKLLGLLLIQCGRQWWGTAACSKFFKWRKVCILIPSSLRTVHLSDLPLLLSPRGWHGTVHNKHFSSWLPSLHN